MREPEGLQNIPQALTQELSRHGLTPEELDRRLDWPKGKLRRLLAEKVLQIDELRQVLAAAGLSESAFFAELYDLELRRAARMNEEIPFSTGLLSDQDTEFPSRQEVAGLFKLLVQEGLRHPRDPKPGLNTGNDFPEDPPARAPRRRGSR
jgi:hypothetical protein